MSTIRPEMAGLSPLEDKLSSRRAPVEEKPARRTQENTLRRTVEKYQKQLGFTQYYNFLLCEYPHGAYPYRVPLEQLADSDFQSPYLAVSGVSSWSSAPATLSSPASALLLASRASVRQRQASATGTLSSHGTTLASECISGPWSQLVSWPRRNSFPRYEPKP